MMIRFYNNDKSVVDFLKNNALILTCLLLFSACSRKSSGDAGSPPPPPPAQNEVDFWLTKKDQSVIFQKQNTILAFGKSVNQYPNIEIDDNSSYQTIDGFG
ncbi:MAG TPA: hypothetical protein VFS31_17900, partial [Chitinophagaceae bacterium]|nr:hypothetical protein [Chitinophagaceae bacterium]